MKENLRTLTKLSIFLSIASRFIRTNKKDDFVDSYFKQNTDWAVNYGRHDYDVQIADYSDKGIQERVEWYKNQMKLAHQFKEADLSAEQRIEKQNFLRVIDQNLFLQAL